jgi:DNA-binding CsgD family transcriptional regulator
VTDQDRKAPTDEVPSGPITADQPSELHLHTEELRVHRRSLMSNLRVLMGETVVQGERLRDEWQQHGELQASVATHRERLRDQYGMTPREIEVAALLAQGLSNIGVAGRLRISPHTARHHTQRVLAKLGVHSRAEAAARLRR